MNQLEFRHSRSKAEANNYEAGEIITSDTKINLYIDKYNVVLCLDFSKSMNTIDQASGRTNFQKLKDVLGAVVSSLRCRVQKNDKVNRENFTFQPKISLTIVGCGLPNLLSKHLQKTHVCNEDAIECSLPIILLNHDVDFENVWGLIQKINSQISRLENLALKVLSRVKSNYCSENLDIVLQNVIFLLTKSEPSSLPVVVYVSNLGSYSKGNAAYNSIEMQLCRLDVRLIVISLEDDKNYTKKFGYVDSNESVKVLAMMSKGYYLEYKQATKIFKCLFSEPSLNARIEKSNKKNRLTAFQRMVYCRPLYYDSMFGKKSNIIDFRSIIAQQRNPDKNKKLSKHFEDCNHAKLIRMAFAPVYRKVQFTEYYLKTNFKNVCESRTFESFSLRSIKSTEDKACLLSAEFTYYFGVNITINYILSEVVQDQTLDSFHRKWLKVKIFAVSTEEIIKKLKDDTAHNAPIKLGKKSLSSYMFSARRMISKFVKNIFL